MEALINDLLKYSQVGRMEQKIETVDAAGLVQDVIATLLVPPEVTIQVVVPVLSFMARALSLRQIFANLLSNAIKYGCPHQQGEVVISAEERQDEYEFAIADSGPGIDEDNFERIFDIFQTLQNRKDSSSTGIGLAIVKKLIEVEGGRVWVDSKVGRGTTFRFTWPRYTSLVVTLPSSEAAPMIASI